MLETELCLLYHRGIPSATAQFLARSMCTINICWMNAFLSLELMEHDWVQSGSEIMMAVETVFKNEPPTSVTFAHSW